MDKVYFNSFVNIESLKVEMRENNGTPWKANWAQGYNTDQKQLT